MKIVLALAVLAALVPSIAASACSATFMMPGVGPACDPVANPTCTCVLPFNATFDPSNPWGDCPTCPTNPPSCPELAAPAGKTYICKRLGGPNHPHYVLRLRHLEDNGLPELESGDFIPDPSTCCNCDRDLCNARLASLYAYTSSFGIFYGVNVSDAVALHQAYTQFVNQLTAIFTEECYTTVQGIGSFGPRTINVEYQLIVTPIAGDAALTQAIGQYSSQWLQGGNVFTSGSCSRVRYNVANSFQSTIIGYDQVFTYTFEPGTARIADIFLRPACAALKPVDPPSLPQIYGICGGLGVLCQNISTYDFNGPDGFSRCVAFWQTLAQKSSAIVSGACDYKYPATSDTADCRQVHYLSAAIDPTVHCPHTNVVSSTCFDRFDDNPGATCPYYTPRAARLA